MARKGRPPKPVELKVIEGNRGKRKISTAGPAKPAPSKPSRPSWLTAGGRAEWDRITPKLDELGLLTQVDRSTLAAYCEAVSTHREATKIIDAKGLLVKGQRGEAVKNPALQIQRDAARLIATYSSMFGLSASDRARALDTSGRRNPASDLDAILGP